MSPRERSDEGPALGRGGTLFLLATVFCSGTAVMIVEMTAVRAIQPFFGSTTYVWTNVIAVVLAALAVGYAVGGRLADRRPSALLLYGLLGTGGLILVAVTWLITPVSRMFLRDGLDLEGMVTVLTRGSLGATLVLYAPPILLLGMISPLAIRLLAKGGVGRAAGRVFAISTVGSILGTYLPTFVLVPHVGSRGSILVAAAILCVVAAVGALAFGGWRRAGVPVAILLVALGARGGLAASRGDLAAARPAPPLLDGGTSEVLAEVESPYQYLTVRRDSWPDGPTQRILTINEGIYTYHSLQVEGHVLTQSRYYDDYGLVPFLLDVEPGAELRACIVGMACGINAIQWKHFWANDDDPVYDLRIDGAELDPAVVRLGREHFGMPGPVAEWLRVYEMDGRQMLEALPAETRYHAIVVDAFANELYIPFHLATREFFELCRRKLEPGGVLAMNVYALGEEPPNLVAIENTLAAVFGRCVRVRQYTEGSHLLLTRLGDEPPDLGRLAPARIRERFRSWEGYPRWVQVDEWGQLLALARYASDAPADGRSRIVEPRADEWVLTDDRAPLEYLTDRFLDATEARVLGEDEEWGRRVTGLLRSQARGLGFVGLGWAAALVGGFWFLRRRDLL